jgi:beta-N-acetylhexosaminidase
VPRADVAASKRELTTLAFGVLLPATDDLEPSSVRRLFERGCRSALLGETRAEYLARTMSEARRARETPDLVRKLVRDLRERAAGPVIVAVDDELVGIRRFDHLLGGASRPPTETSSAAEVTTFARARAAELTALGVNTVLGPILDVVRGTNPWLRGRNLASDPETVARLGAATIDGLQGADVSAIAKHYPGHAVVEDEAIAIGSLDGPEVRREDERKSHG